MLVPALARSRTFVLGLLLATGFVLLPTSAHAAGDAAAEVKTAATHAGLASKAGTADVVHLHLHHVLNCLVGPKGADFDAAAGNPCAQQGNGAIPDSTNEAQQKALQDVVAKAKSGVAESDLARAKQIATDVASMLAAVMKK